MPHSVILAIADPPERETEIDGKRKLVPGTWAPPEHRILPELIEQGRAALEELLKPCGAAGVGPALMPLLLSQVMPNTEGMSDETMQSFFAAKVSEYTRHLEHFPADIIRAACDDHARNGSAFFPALFDLTKHAKPAHEKRKRELERVMAVQRNAKAPRIAAAPKFVREPDDVLHRAAVARFHKFKGGMVHDTLRRAAIESETWLAVHEGREPDLEQFGTATPSIAPPMPRRSTHSGRKQAIDVEEQPPLPKMEAPTLEGDFQRVEEPPIPDDIPE